MRGDAAFLQNAGLGRGGTQSDALGWDAVSRWDTGRRCEGLVGRRGLWGERASTEPRGPGAWSERACWAGRAGALRAQGEL
jgi:hypothetical protein